MDDISEDMKKIEQVLPNRIAQLTQLLEDQKSLKGFTKVVAKPDSKHSKDVLTFLQTVSKWAVKRIAEAVKNNEPISISDLTQRFTDLVSNKPARVPASVPRPQPIATPLPTVVDTTTKSPAAILRRQMLEFSKKYQGLAQKPINVTLANGQKSEGIVTALNFPNVVVFLKTGGQIEVDPENFTVRRADGKEEAKESAGQ